MNAFVGHVEGALDSTAGIPSDVIVRLTLNVSEDYPVFTHHESPVHRNHNATVNDSPGAAAAAAAAVTAGTGK